MAGWSEPLTSVRGKLDSRTSVKVPKVAPPSVETDTTVRSEAWDVAMEAPLAAVPDVDPARVGGVGGEADVAEALDVANGRAVGLGEVTLLGLLDDRELPRAAEVLGAGDEGVVRAGRGGVLARGAGQVEGPVDAELGREERPEVGPGARLVPRRHGLGRRLGPRAAPVEAHVDAAGRPGEVDLGDHEDVGVVGVHEHLRLGVDAPGEDVGRDLDVRGHDRTARLLGHGRRDEHRHQQAGHHSKKHAPDHEFSPH